MSSANPTPNSATALAHPAASESARHRAKRRKGLNALLDAEAWEYNDAEIVNASRETWRSPVYDHYDVALERHFDGLGEPAKLVFRFDCKFQSPHHNPQLRDRARTGDGTQNLLSSARACDRQRGTYTPADASLYPPLSYSAARHRAILALRCARDRRPFESVVDELHRQEVEMLRPGTELPSAVTISRDVRRIYDEISVDVSEYLKSVPGALHLAVDGWTSPTSESYLGVIVFWYDGGKMWRSVLEFIRLTEAHTGNYLAERIRDCLVRYGVEDKIMSICLDNASNNNTLVTRLQELLPGFEGPRSRGFMALFTAPPKQGRGRTTASAQPAPPPNVAADDPSLDPEDPTDDVDPDKLAHDVTIAQGVATEAISIMSSHGVNVSATELKSAHQIMPKVAGLARRINDSATLKTKFAQLVDSDPELEGDAHSLERRVATRWNTDGRCLRSHLHFRSPVQWMTNNPNTKLKKYALDDYQWNLATELSDILEIFQEPTDRFSQAEVPLVHETLPELLTLRLRLLDIRNDTLNQDLQPITRVAAEAALQVFSKYLATMEESDIYVIAVVMCPDRKLKWFSDRGVDIGPIRTRVVERYNLMFPGQHETQNPNHVPGAVRTSGSIWTRRHTSSPEAPVYLMRDSIEEYLETPVVSSYVISQYGGVLSYWNSELERRPRMARMALDFLTVPASSVDAERAFSGGRLMINHLQHRMSSQSFQAQMALGSWFGTPLLPELENVARVLEKYV